MQPRTPRPYAAFISYSHVDRARARWLHSRLESFVVPRALRGRDCAYGTVGARIAPVFIDRAELASSSDLASSVRSALDASAFLVVVCSPDAARSRWVSEEVRHFKARGRAERVLAIIVAGEPRVTTGSSDDAGCFPPALWFDIDGAGVTTTRAREPLAADVRPGMDEPDDALLKLAAAILGVSFDDLRRRERSRKQRRLAVAATVSSVAAIVFAALAVTAWIARNDAQAQKALAEQKSRTAERTSEFLKSLFRVSDPSEARGNSITAREILDRGVRQLAAELRDEPEVRADLSTTLGEVYGGLGLYTNAKQLLKDALAIPNPTPFALARRRAALAEVEFFEGGFPESEQLFRLALPEFEKHAADAPAELIRALTGWGNTLASLDRYPEAHAAHARAMRLANSAFGADSEPYARALEGSGYASFYAGDYAASRAAFVGSLAIRRRVSGADHPATLETLNQLGAVEYMLGHRDDAARYLEESLSISRRVLGDRHAELEGRLNNLGRIELERRRFEHASQLLDDALQIHLSQRADVVTDVTFTLANLAIARARSGRWNEADSLFDRALRTAGETKHRLEGPILTDWAELDCGRGRTAQAFEKLARARPLSAERYPGDPWRVAIVDSVQAQCEIARHRYVAAERLLKASSSTILAKWPPDTLYGYDVVQRNIDLYERLSQPDKAAEFRRMLR